MSLKGQSKREIMRRFAAPGPAVERPQLPATGRAGRNLPAAIGVAVVLGALVLVGILFWPPIFFLIVIAAVVLGSYELA